MKQLIIILFGIGVLFIGLVVEAGEPDQLTFDDATVEMETKLRQVVSWDEVPALAYPITISFVEGTTPFAGASGIVFNTDTLPEYVTPSFLHEYGHVWDRHTLSAGDRQAILDLNGITGTWSGGPYIEQPEERFAATFATTILRTRSLSIGANAYYAPLILFTDIGGEAQEMQDAVVWLYGTGVTKGTSLTTFSPDRPVTRGQMALFLKRFYDRFLTP